MQHTDRMIWNSKYIEKLNNKLLSRNNIITEKIELNDKYKQVFPCFPGFRFDDRRQPPFVGDEQKNISWPKGAPGPRGSGRVKSSNDAQKSTLL